MSEPRGWFADVGEWDADQELWQPYLDTGQGHVPCFDVWFNTEAECVTWIKENVLGVGMFEFQTYPLLPEES